MITILTPTYNRAELLKSLFASLCSQTCFDFEWLIVDDGSTDDTSLVVKTFKSDKFPIRYYLKENGGKHTALNYSHPYIKGELLFIVDSDDILTPDAINTINKNFDLRPGAIIRDLDLRRPIYKQTAAYGHFGRTDIDLPWERTDKAEILREQSSIK